MDVALSKHDAGARHPITPRGPYYTEAISTSVGFPIFTVLLLAGDEKGARRGKKAPARLGTVIRRLLPIYNIYTLNLNTLKSSFVACLVPSPLRKQKSTRNGRGLGVID